MIALTDLVSQKKISEETMTKVLIAQRYIEDKYNRNITKQFEREMIQDKINSLFSSQNEKKIVKAKINEVVTNEYHKKTHKMSFNDYEKIKQIGKGSLGEIWLCQDKKTKEIVAIKKVNKRMIHTLHQERHIIDEQYFLQNVSSQWIVELKKSFEEKDDLYLVMEYLPGGDLMGQLILKDKLKENEAKFYLAELILAIEEVHIHGALHRDIKPDNILIDKLGHIKLCDFGLIKIVDEALLKKNYYVIRSNNDKDDDCKYKYHKKAYSKVGTPLYVAPEVLSSKIDGYDNNIDFWSAGVIFYEMLFGHSPFIAQKEQEIYHQIKNFQKFLKIPKNISISNEAKDLIYKMLSPSHERLGISEIKNHNFFKHIDWKNIRRMKAHVTPIFESTFNINDYPKSTINQNDDEALKTMKTNEFLCYNYDRKEHDKSTIIKVLDLISQCKSNFSKLLLDEESEAVIIRSNCRIQTLQTDCQTIESMDIKLPDPLNKRNKKLSANFKTKYTDIQNCNKNDSNNRDLISVVQRTEY